MQTKRKKLIDIAIDLTPLIDVVFVLLIFILVSSTFLNKSAFKIQLPKVSKASHSTTQQSFSIFINSTGNYWIEESNTTIQAEKTQLLKKVLDRLYKLNPNATIKIFADAQAHYQSLMSLLDHLSYSGYQKINLMNRPKENE